MLRPLISVKVGPDPALSANEVAEGFDGIGTGLLLDNAILNLHGTVAERRKLVEVLASSVGLQVFDPQALVRPESVDPPPPAQGAGVPGRHDPTSSPGTSISDVATTSEAPGTPDSDRIDPEVVHA